MAARVLHLVAFIVVVLRASGTLFLLAMSVVGLLVTQKI